MQDYTKPVWSFTRTNEDGTTDIKSFEAVTWSQALQEFVNFVKGCGYILTDDSVQISSDYECEHWFGNYCTPAEDDWKHPNDSLAAWNVPPFQGDPNDCAFNNSEGCDDCSCMDCEEDEQPFNLLFNDDNNTVTVSATFPMGHRETEMFKVIDKFKDDVCDLMEDYVNAQ